MDHAFDGIDIMLDDLGNALNFDQGGAAGKDDYQDQLDFYNKLVVDYGRATISREKKNELNVMVNGCISAANSTTSK